MLPCRGSGKDTRGTAYIVYEDIYDAKTAVDHLSGFNVANRYLIVLCAPASELPLALTSCSTDASSPACRYYNTTKHSKKVRTLLLARLAAPAPTLMHPAVQLSTKDEEEKLRDLQAKHGVSGEQEPRAAK